VVIGTVAIDSLVVIFVTAGGMVDRVGIRPLPSPLLRAMYCTDCSLNPNPVGAVDRPCKFGLDQNSKAV